MSKTPSETPHDHEHDHEDEELEEEGDFGDMEEDDDIVTLVDAEGNEADYHMMGVVEVDGESFALLTPAVEDEGEEDDAMEVMLMGYDEDEDGGMIFSDIEDEALFAKVQAAAEQFFSEMMGDDAEEA